MLTLAEFKVFFKSRLEGLCEEDVKRCYRIYLQDPFNYDPLF